MAVPACADAEQPRRAPCHGQPHAPKARSQLGNAQGFADHGAAVYDVKQRQGMQ